jgi:hypothetical protein
MRRATGVVAGKAQKWSSDAPARGRSDRRLWRQGLRRGRIRQGLRGRRRCPFTAPRDRTRAVGCCNRAPGRRCSPARPTPWRRPEARIPVPKDGGPVRLCLRCRIDADRAPDGLSAVVGCVAHRPIVSRQRQRNVAAVMGTRRRGLGRRSDSHGWGMTSRGGDRRAFGGGSDTDWTVKRLGCVRILRGPDDHNGHHSGECQQSFGFQRPLLPWDGFGGGEGRPARRPTVVLSIRLQLSCHTDAGCPLRGWQDPCSIGMTAALCQWFWTVGSL